MVMRIGIATDMIMGTTVTGTANMGISTTVTVMGTTVMGISITVTFIITVTCIHTMGPMPIFFLCCRI
jgi:hypothetical protein